MLEIGWDTGMSREKEGWRRQSLPSVENGDGGMGGHNRFPSIELRMRELDFRSSRQAVALPPVDLLP